MRVPREAMIKKLRVREVDGGARVVESKSFPKVSDDLDADSSDDRSVGVASCDDMLFNTKTRKIFRRRRSQTEERSCCTTSLNYGC
jgi:hypothetical protein